MKGAVVGIGVLVVLLIGLLVIGGSYVSTKNTLVEKNEAVTKQYHDLDAQLQRRLDLIPNLVASVKGYVKEETTILTNIANARAGVIAAGSDREASIQANKQLSVALGPLYRLQENYPQLKGNEQFMRLEDELAGTENRINVARMKYNDTLNDYNVYVKQFPHSIWAGMAGYHYRDEYFNADAAAKNAPKVDFNN